MYVYIYIHIYTAVVKTGTELKAKLRDLTGQNEVFLERGKN